MTEYSADAEAQFAEHIAECDACLEACQKGEPLPADNCIDEIAEWEREHPDWSGRLETTLKGW